MSDQPGRESISDDLTVYGLDDEDQLQPEDTLIGEDDPLDEGYSPPDRLHGVTAHGVTAEEQTHNESISQRVMQETRDDAEPVHEDDRVGTLLSPDEGSGHDDEPDAVAREEHAYSNSAEESAMHYTDFDTESDPDPR